MKKIRLVAYVTVSVYTDVWADDEDGAISAVRDREMSGVISTDNPDETWVCDELDGYPFNISLE